MFLFDFIPSRESFTCSRLGFAETYLCKLFSAVSFSKLTPSLRNPRNLCLASNYVLCLCVGLTCVTQNRTSYLLAHQPAQAPTGCLPCTSYFVLRNLDYCFFFDRIPSSSTSTVSSGVLIMIPSLSILISASLPFTFIPSSFTLTS